MDHHPSATATRTESERLLSIAEKLLHSRDLTGAREFALLAQETDPLLEDSDQIIAITDVLLASENNTNNHNNNRHHGYYSILQTEPGSDQDLLRKNYRRLALLLHPDKNNYPLADVAFKLVADAWGTLSKVDLQDKLPVRRNQNQNQNVQQSRGMSNFWTTCPYCYVLYQYPRVYKDCCVRCQNCERGFHAAVLPSLPPLVPGKEAYYCCWGFFPLGFSAESSGKGKKVDSNNADNVNPNRMPGMFSGAPAPQNNLGNVIMNAGFRGVVDFSNGVASGGFGNAMPGMSAPGAKKRGRPRKNPLGL